MGQIENSSLKRIWQLVEDEIFSPIDVYFAQTLLKDASSEVQNESLFLYAYLFSVARQGHFCLEIFPDGKIHPSPSWMIDEEGIGKEIEQKVSAGIAHLSSSFCQEVTEDSPAPLTPLCRFQNRLYLQKNWLLETKFLFHLQRLLKSSPQFCLKDPKIENTLLNQEQRKAVALALSSSICFLSGGPGSGKTFTAAEIAKTFLASLPEEERKNASIKIAAPTGKAAAHLEKQLASQLENLAKIECKTLHSFLKSPMKKHSPTLFADLFLIDEASMLDGALFTRLLSSFQGGGRLVLIGDKDQLPPVESGSFFADLMQVAKIADLPSLSLQECLRVEKKELLTFARAILDGDEEKVFSSSFVSFFSSSQISEIRSWIQEQYIDPSLQILSCIRKGPLGVESINEMMLQKFLEGKEDDALLSVPILITKNCEEMQLMNGDTGTLVAKVSSFRKKRFTADEKAHFSQRIFSAVTLPPFEWGYCLSVHKSQGSEYDRVIALVPPGSERFGREVLYTAVTRAKKEILLVGEMSVLSMLLQKSSRKMSGLSSRLITNLASKAEEGFVCSCIE